MIITWNYYNKSIISLKKFIWNKIQKYYLIKKVILLLSMK